MSNFVKIITFNEFLTSNKFLSIIEFVHAQVSSKRELLGPVLDIMSKKQDDEVSLS